MRDIVNSFVATLVMLMVMAFTAVMVLAMIAAGVVMGLLTMVARALPSQSRPRPVQAPRPERPGSPGFEAAARSPAAARRRGEVIEGTVVSRH